MLIFVSTINQMEFEFDPGKAASNLTKHGVSFDEAATALLDELALAYEDVDSEDEPRWKLVGMSAFGALLMVVYTLRGEHGETPRLISARPATKQEETAYAKQFR
jgi:uncharacterized DUF497 family protein